MVNDLHSEPLGSKGISQSVARSILNLPIWFCFLALLTHTYLPHTSIANLFERFAYIGAGAYVLAAMIVLIGCKRGTGLGNFARFLFSCSCLAIVMLGR